MPQELEPVNLAESDPELVETLGGVTSEVLETMFFTEAMASDCEHAWLLAAISAQVHFEGSHLGDMLLTVSREAADSLAPSFLGIEAAETTDVERGQVILELSNILCGTLVSRLWPESELSLSSPSLADSLLPLEGALHRCFTLPEGLLAVSIRLISAPEPA